MSWLPMYLLDEDLALLLERLDQDDELAWLVSNGGSGDWVAQMKHPDPCQDRYTLWHIPSGRLPLFNFGDRRDRWVKDPWKGWHQSLEGYSGSDDQTPAFAARDQGVYHLQIKPHVVGESAEIGLSSFSWIRNHFAAIGYPAATATERHWRRFGRWIASNSTKIPREGPIDGAVPEIYAFPQALSRIREGTARALNP